MAERRVGEDLVVSDAVVAQFVMEQLVPLGLTAVRREIRVGALRPNEELGLGFSRPWPNVPGMRGGLLVGVLTNPASDRVGRVDASLHIPKEIRAGRRCVDFATYRPIDDRLGVAAEPLEPGEWGELPRLSATPPQRADFPLFTGIVEMGEIDDSVDPEILAAAYQELRTTDHMTPAIKMAMGQ